MDTFLDLYSNNTNNTNLINPKTHNLSSINSDNSIINFENSNDIYLEVDKDFAEPGDILTYTVTIKNTTNTPTLDIILKHISSNDITLVGGSVYVNDVLQGVADPLFLNGISIGSLNPNQTSKIVFKATVMRYPTNSMLYNTASIKFNYLDGSTLIEGASTSNSVVTFVNKAIISNETHTFIKTVDKSEVDLNCCLLYTITIINKGDTVANNILLTDIIPPESELVPGSLCINSVSQDYSPLGSAIVIPVGSLNPNTSFIFSYKVKIIRYAGKDIIKNSARLTYSYLLSLSGNVIEKEVDSNEVSTYIKTADFSGLNFHKSCDKSYTDLNDIINYEIVIRNNGNIPAEKAVLKDIIPKGTELVPESLYINETLILGGTHKNLLNFDVIAPGEKLLVKFKANVVSIVNNGIIKSSSTFSYRYLVNTGTIKLNTITSNEVLTYINTAILDLKIDSSKSYAEVDEEIFYTLTLKNIGTVLACGINLIDIIDPCLEYKLSSLYLNGCTKCDQVLTKGIYINELMVNESLVITFVAKVLDIPKCSQAVNQAKATYSYRIKDCKSQITKTTFSNKSIIFINDVDFSGDNFLKTADKVFATIDDYITYTVSIKNTGNIVAKNVVFRDDIDICSEFVQGTFTIDNSKPIPNVDLISGVDIGNIQPNSTIILSYKVLISTLPSINPIHNMASIDYNYFTTPNKISTKKSSTSNYCSVVVNAANVTLSKKSCSDVAIFNEDITYEIIAKNSGNVPALNLIIRDKLSSFLEFIPNSINVNGQVISGNIINGVNIGALYPDEVKIIRFTAKVINYTKGVYIVNEAESIYSFILDNKNYYINKSVKSNTCSLQIEKVDVQIEKSCDSTTISVGKTVTFTVNITNQSSLPVNNFLYKDLLPDELIYSPNSLTLNDNMLRSGNIRTGIRIGTINPRQKLILSYAITLDTLPRSNTLTSDAFGEYCYQLLNYIACSNIKTNVETLSLCVITEIFKPLNIDSSLLIPTSSKCISEITNIKAAIDIINSSIIKSSEEKYDNFSLKENKILIVGDLNQNIDYLTNDDESLEKTAEFQTRFRTFIPLPKDYKHIKNIQVTPIIEDTCFSIIGDKKITTNVLFVLKINIQ